MTNHSVRTLTRSLALSLLVPLAAFAGEEQFTLEGPNVTGRAVLRGVDVMSGRGTFQLDGLRLSKKARTGEPWTLSGQAERVASDALVLTYSRQRGFLGRLTGPDEEQVVVRLESLMGPRAGWDGEIEGQRVHLVWERAPIPSDLVVLVVPGLSTNLWNQYGVPYLDENMAVLKARGYEARRLAINTEASVRTNATVIGSEIRSEIARGKRVLLIAHSKGGADTITALSDPLNRDLLPHVAGLVAIQPVYAGSPVADEVGKSALVQALADKAFSCIFPLINRVDDTGSGDAVRDLRSEARRALLSEHPFPLELQARTVVIRGSFSKRPLAKFGRHPLCEPLVGLQIFLEKRRGLQSDGMVSLENQRIPGARAEFVYTNLDHFEPGFRNESPHTPAEITAKALELIAPVIDGPAYRRR